MATVSVVRVDATGAVRGGPLCKLHEGNCEFTYEGELEPDARLALTADPDGVLLLSPVWRKPGSPGGQVANERGGGAPSVSQVFKGADDRYLARLGAMWASSQDPEVTHFLATSEWRQSQNGFELRPKFNSGKLSVPLEVSADGDSIVLQCPNKPQALKLASVVPKEIQRRLSPQSLPQKMDELVRRGPGHLFWVPPLEQYLYLEGVNGRRLPEQVYMGKKGALRPIVPTAVTSSPLERRISILPAVELEAGTFYPSVNVFDENEHGTLRLAGAEAPIALDPEIVDLEKLRELGLEALPGEAEVDFCADRAPRRELKALSSPDVSVSRVVLKSLPQMSRGPMEVNVPILGAEIHAALGKAELGPAMRLPVSIAGISADFQVYRGAAGEWQLAPNFGSFMSANRSALDAGASKLFLVIGLHEALVFSDPGRPKAQKPDLSDLLVLNIGGSCFVAELQDNARGADVDISSKRVVRLKQCPALGAPRLFAPGGGAAEPGADHPEVELALGVPAGASEVAFFEADEMFHPVMSRRLCSAKEVQPGNWMCSVTQRRSAPGPLFAIGGARIAGSWRYSAPGRLPAGGGGLEPATVIEHAELRKAGDDELELEVRLRISPFEAFPNEDSLRRSLTILGAPPVPPKHKKAANAAVQQFYQPYSPFSSMAFEFETVSIDRPARRVTLKATLSGSQARSRVQARIGRSCTEFRLMSRHDQKQPGVLRSFDQGQPQYACGLVQELSNSLGYLIGNPYIQNTPAFPTKVSTQLNLSYGRGYGYQSALYPQRDPPLVPRNARVSFVRLDEADKVVGEPQCPQAVLAPPPEPKFVQGPNQPPGTGIEISPPPASCKMTLNEAEPGTVRIAALLEIDNQRLLSEQVEIRFQPDPIREQWERRMRLSQIVPDPEAATENADFDRALRQARPESRYFADAKGHVLALFPQFPFWTNAFPLFWGDGKDFRQIPAETRPQLSTAWASLETTDPGSKDGKLRIERTVKGLKVSCGEAPVELNEISDDAVIESYIRRARFHSVTGKVSARYLGRFQKSEEYFFVASVTTDQAYYGGGTPVSVYAGRAGQLIALTPEEGLYFGDLTYGLQLRQGLLVFPSANLDRKPGFYPPTGKAVRYTLLSAAGPELKKVLGEEIYARLAKADTLSVCASLRGLKKADPVPSVQGEVALASGASVKKAGAGPRYTLHVLRPGSLAPLKRLDLGIGTDRYVFLRNKGEDLIIKGVLEIRGLRRRDDGTYGPLPPGQSISQNPNEIDDDDDGEKAALRTRAWRNASASTQGWATRRGQSFEGVDLAKLFGSLPPRPPEDGVGLLDKMVNFFRKRKAPKVDPVPLPVPTVPADVDSADASVDDTIAIITADAGTFDIALDRGSSRKDKPQRIFLRDPTTHKELADISDFMSSGGHVVDAKRNILYYAAWPEDENALELNRITAFDLKTMKPLREALVTGLGAGWEDDEPHAAQIKGLWLDRSGNVLVLGGSAENSR